LRERRAKLKLDEKALEEKRKQEAEAEAEKRRQQRERRKGRLAGEATAGAVVELDD